MPTRLTRWWRAAVLRTRVLKVEQQETRDPFAPEYLYLVLQHKRLGLATTIGRLRPRNLLLFPVIIAIVLAKLLDLAISNQIVRALINERDLMERICRPDADRPR
jgi:hypothetical protein